MTASNTRQNLRLDVQGSENVRKAGETIKRFVTVKNQGQQNAKIDVWIEAKDQQSDLLKWVRWSNASPIFLSADATCQITLQFDIPIMTRPGFYDYEIHAESSAYPGEVIKRSQQLEVLPSERYLEDRNEPTFTIQPHTSSNNPYLLKAGQTLDVEILVENRSKRVERFSVSCPELLDWIQEAPTELPLNPGTSGTLTLQLQPPEGAIAGNYSSTLRLNTHTQSNLTFLGILYLQLEINDQLSLSLIDETPAIPDAQKRFTIRVANPGNIERPIAVVPKDSAKLFHYSWKAVQLSGASGDVKLPFGCQRRINPWRSRECDKVQLSLAPNEELSLNLAPTLTLKPWRRLWIGRNREIPFTIELQNTHSDSTEVLFLPDPQTGTLLWKPYPRWLIALLILIPAFMVLKLIHEGLWQFVVKPSLMPKVAEFSIAEKSYQAENNTPIRLNWEIHNLGLLKTLKLTQVTEAENKKKSVILPYSKVNNFKQDQLYPEHYQLVEEQIRSKSWLPSTQIKQPSENQPYCNIIPIPTQNSWLQSLWESLYATTLEMQSYKIAKGFALRCQQVITPATQPGSYSFKLELENNTVQPNQPLDAKTIQGLPIISPAPGEIIDFSAATTIYREAPNTQEPSQSSAKFPLPPILLNWTVRNPKRLQSLNLSWIRVDYDGKISRSSQPIIYPLELLRSDPVRCQFQEEERLLICKNLPIPASGAGQYTFTLTTRSSNPPTQSLSATKTLPNIQVRPPAPKINRFTVNGKNAIEIPKQVLVLNPAIGSVDVTLSWEIPNRERMKVELLPAPGVIDSNRPSTLPYSLSPKSTNAITLRVTNQVGEVIERSAVIETTEYVSPERAVLPSSSPLPQSSPPPGGAAPSHSPAKPEKPGDLSPYELPPKTN